MYLCRQLWLHPLMEMKIIATWSNWRAVGQIGVVLDWARMSVTRTMYIHRASHAHTRPIEDDPNLTDRTPI